jgi:hypothetical protein
MPRCSQCGEERAKSEYSSSQVKLKPHARRCKLCVIAGIPVADPQPRSISSAFMTAAELPTGLADDKYLRLARVYMDHDFPVTMSDGSPKQIPEAALRCADAAELRQTFGYGSGGFFGEVLFWKRWRGVLLGKQKWSCHSDTPEGDTAPMSELWDMRWVFPSRELARAFHADMVGASREEGGRGYLDGPDDPDDADCPGALRERPDVLSGLLDQVGCEIHGLVFSMNSPLPLPSPGARFKGQLYYLQQLSAVFVVDRVVAKLYVASGFGSRDSRGRHIGTTPTDFVRIVCAASASISRWLAGDSAGGSATVSMPSSHGSLMAEQLGGGIALSPGCKVRIAGLQSRADLNGLIGTVLPGGPQSGRLAVRVTLQRGVASILSARGALGADHVDVHAHECVRIKPANLLPVFDTPGVETQGLCSICMDVEMCTIVGDQQNATFMICCGKPICLHCLHDIETSGELRDVCPFCRADTSDTSDEATIRGLKQRMQHGDPAAQYNLACHYDYGRMGLPLDQAEARRLYQLAAEQGHARAAANLACSHRDGEGGPVDLVQAARWFKVATDRGHIQACTNLGIAYMRGDGVPQSRVEAIHYLTRGAQAGDELAAMQLMRMGVQPMAAAASQA